MAQDRIVGVLLRFVAVFIVAPFRLVPLDHHGGGLGLDVPSPPVAHHPFLKAALLGPAFSPAVREVFVLDGDLSHRA